MVSDEQTASAELDECLKMNVLQVISDRRSHRKYEDRQLPEDVLRTILTAALESPSARNRQPWHFSVCQNPALIQAVHDAAAREMGKGGSPRFADPDYHLC